MKKYIFIMNHQISTKKKKEKMIKRKNRQKNVESLPGGGQHCLQL
jgi:hypothetical protein